MYSDAIDLIRKKIEDARMQQVEVARRANISPAQVSRILTRKSTASAENLAALAEAVGISPDVVLELAGILRSSQPQDRFVRLAAHIIENYRHEETRQRAIDLLEFLARQEDKEKDNVGKKHPGRTVPAHRG